MKDSLSALLFLLSLILIIIVYKLNTLLQRCSTHTPPSGKKTIVKDSLIPNSGRGVFATDDIKEGEVIEVCPIIIESNIEAVQKSFMKDYVFTDIDDDSKRVFALGLCSMYNHKEDFNVFYSQEKNPDNMILTAMRDIQKGEELYITYGKDYWESRQGK
tara:strand:- start:110 stop:586 length:477 start_codon:yes stop_codon:yes gene_type:complete